MENATDIIAAIERLGGFFVLLLGALGALYTAISVGRKAMIEATSKADNEKGLLEINKKQKALDATKAMQDLYNEFVEDMNEKFKVMTDEVHNLRNRQSETDCKLEQVTKERNIFKEAGIRLIRAIEEGLELRSAVSAEVNNCKACTIADKALLKTLNEVKILFENGVK